MVGRVRALAIGTVGSFIAACSFGGRVELGEAPGADASVGEDAEPAPDAPPMVAPCSAPDPTGLVVCFELEDDMGDGVLVDSSPAGLHATSMGLVPTTRDPASKAAEVGADAVTYVPQTPALDLQGGYTLALWIKPASLPAAGEVRGLLDHEQQYAMFVRRTVGGALQNTCANTAATFDWTEELPLDTWSLLACTWNGAQLCAYRWTSPTSHERYCHTPSIIPADAGTRGLAIGHLSEDGVPHSRFEGAIDSIQVYGRGMTEAQVCALVGEAPGCMPCNYCQ
jgi:hypothetical protein